MFFRSEFEKKLELEPSDEIRFTYIPNTNIMSSLFVNNISSSKMMFRVHKTKNFP